MKIISQFKDYYDIGMGLGYDDSILYIRDPREVVLKPKDRRDESLEDKATREIKLDTGFHFYNDHKYEFKVIGLCGRFYPLIVFSESTFCYSLEDVDRYIETTYNKKFCQDYFNGNTWGPREGTRKLFNYYENLPKNLEPFIINRSPIVVMYELKLDDLNYKSIATWNKCLREYKFERIVGPYVSYQEIEMFLGNLCSPEKPIPPRSDIQKVQSHGFDKWSFRKKKE